MNTQKKLAKLESLTESTVARACTNGSAVRSCTTARSQSDSLGGHVQRTYLISGGIGRVIASCIERLVAEGIERLVGRVVIRIVVVRLGIPGSFEGGVGGAVWVVGDVGAAW